MSIGIVKLYQGDQMVYSKDCRYSCTGVFQRGPYGHKFYDYTPDYIDVSFIKEWGISNGLMEGFINTPLVQALVRTELIEFKPERVVVRFHSGYLPSDRVISAMRLINCWMDEDWRVIPRELAEFELTPAELQVIGIFVKHSAVSSDSRPSIFRVTKAETRAITDQYSLRYKIDKLKKQPHAGMLLPLIRGEIQHGWQEPLKTGGYAKENALANMMLFNHDEYGIGYGIVERCAEDQHLTVNHPLIHSGVEHQVGPLIKAASVIGAADSEVIEWTLGKLGK